MAGEPPCCRDTACGSQKCRFAWEPRTSLGLLQELGRDLSMAGGREGVEWWRNDETQRDQWPVASRRFFTSADFRTLPCHHTTTLPHSHRVHVSSPSLFPGKPYLLRREPALSVSHARGGSYCGSIAPPWAQTSAETLGVGVAASNTPRICITACARLCHRIRLSTTRPHGCRSRQQRGRHRRRA